jgi:hypothetical protein
MIANRAMLSPDVGPLQIDLVGTRRPVPTVAKLEVEILVLRQQINVLRRTAPKRLLLSSIDRLIFVGLYRLFPDVRGALAIVKPDTVIRWRRAGFRAYWRWKDGGGQAAQRRIKDLAAAYKSVAESIGGVRFQDGIEVIEVPANHAA